MKSTHLSKFGTYASVVDARSSTLLLDGNGILADILRNTLLLYLLNGMSATRPIHTSKKTWSGAQDPTRHPDQPILFHPGHRLGERRAETVDAFGLVLTDDDMAQRGALLQKEHSVGVAALGLVVA